MRKQHCRLFQNGVFWLYVISNPWLSLIHVLIIFLSGFVLILIIVVIVIKIMVIVVLLIVGFIKVQAFNYFQNEALERRALASAS